MKSLNLTRSQIIFNLSYTDSGFLQYLNLRSLENLDGLFLDYGQIMPLLKNKRVMEYYYDAENMKFLILLFNRRVIQII